MVNSINVIVETYIVYRGAAIEVTADRLEIRYE